MFRINSPRCCAIPPHQPTQSCPLRSGADLRGAIGAISPSETHESNFVHHDFLQFEKKQHLRCKGILSSIVLSQQCCEVYFNFSVAVAKLLGGLISRHHWNCSPNLTGWIRPCSRCVVESSVLAEWAVFTRPRHHHPGHPTAPRTCLKLAKRYECRFSDKAFFHQ